MVRRWLGVLSVALALLACPSVALAEDASLLDSFSGGFADTVTGESREVDVKDPVRDYEYEPVVQREELNEGTRDGEQPQLTLMQYVQRTIRNGLTVTIDDRDWVPGDYYYGSLRSVLLIVVPVAILFVFFWWGVRKVTRIVMSAFRSGRLSFGGSWSTSRYNPRSYYFGMRKRDL